MIPDRVWPACLIVALLLVVGCSHERPAIPCESLNTSFSQRVLPLMQTNCGLLECHDMVTHSDGIILVNYERIVQAASQVRFMQALRHAPGYEPMPKFADPLNETDIRMLECWIEQGMPEN